MYLGDLIPDIEEDIIRWKHVDSDKTLDPNTLLVSFRKFLKHFQPTSGRIDSDYELAVTGYAFEYLIKNHSEDGILRRVLVSSNVFARMSPSQKMRLVEELQNLDYYVGMCGDGANDCGALKAAHVRVLFGCH